MILKHCLKYSLLLPFYFILFNATARPVLTVSQWQPRTYRWRHYMRALPSGLQGPQVLRQDGASLSCTDTWGVRGELCAVFIKMTFFRFLYRVLEENWGWLRQPAISIYSLFTVILLQLYKFSWSLFFLKREHCFAVILGKLRDQMCNRENSGPFSEC